VFSFLSTAAHNVSRCLSIHTDTQTQTHIHTHHVSCCGVRRTLCIHTHTNRPFHETPTRMAPHTHTHTHTNAHTSFDSGGARSPPRERGEVGGGGGVSGGRTKSAPSARSKSVERPRSARDERDVVCVCVCVCVSACVCPHSVRCEHDVVFLFLSWCVYACVCMCVPGCPIFFCSLGSRPSTRPHSRTPQTQPLPFSSCFPFLPHRITSLYMSAFQSA